MPSFLEIASDAVTSIGQLGVGQTISNEEATQAQRVANRMLQKWSVRRLYIYNTPTIQVALSAGVQNYTMGPSGVFARARPILVQAAQIALPGSADTRTLNILDSTKWGAIRDKGATCSALGLPQDIYPEYSYPNLALHLWTIPSNGAQLYLEIWDLLQQFATLFDTFAMPPSYEEGFIHNLAMELCPYYDMPVTPAIAQLAADGLAAIQQINAQNLGGALGESQTLNPPNVGQPQSAAGG